MAFLCSITVTMSVVTPVLAENSAPDTSTLAELTQEQTLPGIVRALHDNLIDANSITNLMVCYPAIRMKLIDGKPVRWTILLALNSKNSYGGYTSVQQMAALFQLGKPVTVVSLEVPPTTKQLATCTGISDVQVHRLLEGS